MLNRDLVAELQIPEGYVESERARQLEEIERRRRLYQAGRPKLEVRGRTAIVVDDGIATGATMEAALLATRRAGPSRHRRFAPRNASTRKSSSSRSIGCATATTRTNTSSVPATS